MTCNVSCMAPHIHIVGSWTVRLLGRSKAIRTVWALMRRLLFRYRVPIGDTIRFAGKAYYEGLNDQNRVLVYITYHIAVTTWILRDDIANYSNPSFRQLYGLYQAFTLVTKELRMYGCKMSKTKNTLIGLASSPEPRSENLLCSNSTFLSPAARTCVQGFGPKDQISCPGLWAAWSRRVQGKEHLKPP